MAMRSVSSVVALRHRFVVDRAFPRDSPPLLEHDTGERAGISLEGVDHAGEATRNAQVQRDGDRWRVRGEQADSKGIVSLLQPVWLRDVLRLKV